MKNCDIKDCTEQAEHQVKIKVWARGHPKTSVPLEMFSGIGVCAEHRKVVTAKDIFNPEGIAMINNALQRHRKAPIDPDTAEIDFVPIIDGKFEGLN